MKCVSPLRFQLQFQSRSNPSSKRDPLPLSNLEPTKTSSQWTQYPTHFPLLLNSTQIGSNSVDTGPVQTPLIRQIPKIKSSKTGGIAKRKLKSKSARQKQKRVTRLSFIF